MPRRAVSVCHVALSGGGKYWSVSLLSVCVSVCLSVCLSVSLSVSLCVSPYYYTVLSLSSLVYCVLACRLMLIDEANACRQEGLYLVD
jgi:hypothetical protein